MQWTIGNAQYLKLPCQLLIANCLFVMLSYLALLMPAFIFQLQHTDSNSKARAVRSLLIMAKFLLPSLCRRNTAQCKGIDTANNVLNIVKSTDYSWAIHIIYISAQDWKYWKSAGGLHRFIKLEYSHILTDSGAATRFFHWQAREKIKRRRGLLFKVILMDRDHLFTPESVIVYSKEASVLIFIMAFV
jgi:hypothetical protein